MKDAVVATLAAALLSISGGASAQIIERISVGSDGVEANGDSFFHLWDGVSADGRFVVFESDASNLVPSDGNGVRDVFLRDRLLGTTSRISEAVGGGDASAESRHPSISEDGRWIAFTSDADNLVVGDDNGLQDVFVFDRVTGVISRVSLAWDGGEADANSRTPSVSRDGRFIAFRSNATNLVPWPVTWSRTVYVRDMQAGTTEVASPAWNGGEENGGSYYPHIAADGRRVAYVSNSTNLVPGDTNETNDVFVRDLDLDITWRASVDNDGNQGSSASGGYGISADGRFAGFSTDAPLVPDDVPPPAGFRDAFIRDLALGVTERVSVTSTGEAGNDESGSAHLDGSGRYATFQSDASNLVADDSNGLTDIFVRDRATGSTTRLNITAAGAQAIGGVSQLPTLSEDGRFVVFQSLADNLVPDDTLGFMDVFIAHGPATMLADGFETGDASRWSGTSP